MDKNTKELLAWYVNGTLTGADRDRVEAALRSEPGSSSLLAWERAVQTAVKVDPALDVSADRGLYQTMQRIRAETRTKTGPSRAVRRGLLSRLRERVQWSPALALACGVVAVQFAVLGQMWASKNEDQAYAAFRAMNTRLMAKDVFIRIAFKPETTEGDLNKLLRTVKAEIVSGPSQLGDYYLLVKKDGSPDALDALQNNSNVDSAEFVNALPARP